MYIYFANLRTAATLVYILAHRRMPHDVLNVKRLLNETFSTDLDWLPLKFPIVIQAAYIPGCIVYEDCLLPDPCFQNFATAMDTDGPGEPKGPETFQITQSKPWNLVDLSKFLLKELDKRIKQLDLHGPVLVIQTKSRFSGLKVLLEMWFPVKCFTSVQDTLVYIPFKTTLL
jgi:hypothetical protein